MASTCSRCGAVIVQYGATTLGKFSLRSSTTRYKRVITLASFSKVRSGKLVIRVTSSGKPVRLDGILAGR